MISYDSLADEVSQELPGVPRVSVVSMLARVAHDFFSRSGIWKEAVTISTVASQNSYALPSTVGTVPVRTRDVLSVSRSIGRLNKVTRDQFEVWQNGSPQEGSPTRYLTNQSNLLVHPTPKGAEDLTVLVSVYPTLSATELEDEFIHEHRQALIDGAKYRLMIQKGKPWSDPEQAMYYRQQYVEATVEASGRAITDNGAKKISFRPFA